MAKAKGLENLVNVPCPLDKAYAQLVPGTIQEAHDIQRQRIKDTSLRNEWFIVGDGFVYSIEDNQEVLYRTSIPFNPVLKQQNIADAVSQIRQNGHYKVKTDEFSSIQREASKKNGGAKRYVLSELGLTRHDDEWSFYEIDTVEYKKLNKTQRAFAEAVHGKGKQFDESMKMLEEAGKTKTRIYVLNPGYVQKVAKEGAVARVGWLNNVEYSSFDAGHMDVVHGSNCVRGVRRDVALGDAAQKQAVFDYKKAYDAILANPEEALRNLTAKKAAGLLDLANRFYQKQ